MENFLSLMNSIIDSWMSPSSVDIAMDMTIAFMCGAGLFFLLIPFLKEYPESPASESERDIPKDVKRGQKKTSEEAATGKGCTDGGKNVEETKTPAQPMEIPNKQLYLGFTPQPFWNLSQKMDHLPLSQLLSHLRVLEDLIQNNLSRFFWCTFSIFSESVVATAHQLRIPYLGKHKSVRFIDDCDPAEAPSQAKGPHQHSQYQPLHHQLVAPNMVGEKQVQENKILPRSTPKQTPPCFKCWAHVVPCPTTARRMQAFLPAGSLPGKHGLYSKDTKGYDKKKHQKAISKPTEDLPWGTLYSKANRPHSIHPEHGGRLRHHKKPENNQKTTKVEEQQGTPFRFPPFKNRTQVQGQFPENTVHYCKNRPQLSQPAQPSSLNSKPYKCSKCKRSVPTELPLRKDIAKSDAHHFGVGAQKVPGTASSRPREVRKPRKPALRTEKVPSMKPTEHYSLLDAMTKRKPVSNITELPVKHKRPYLQILVARDLTPPGIPESNVPQVGFPSSPICDSKAEYHSKAARVLENLHHQDPGGTRMERASPARLERANFIHSLPEVQETQRAPPPAASHGATMFHPDSLPRHPSSQRPASYFQAANPRQTRTLRGIGKGNLKQGTNLQMAKHAPQKNFQEVDTGHHHQCVTMEGSGESVRTSAKRTTVEVKEEPPHAWRVSLGSSESHNGQDINISPGVFGSLGAKRLLTHLQIPISQHSQDSSQNILSSNQQPRAWPVSHHPVGPSRVHPAEVSLPSQDSLPSFQNTGQNTKTSHALCDVFMRRQERVDTQENRVPTHKTKVWDHDGLHLHEEKQTTLRSTGVSLGERHVRVRGSIPSSTELKDTVKTWIPEKVEATSKTSWKNIPRNPFQCGNLSKTCKAQGDILKDSSFPPATEQTQKVVTRKESIYHMLGELACLMNILSQILENPEGDQSKVKGCKVESLRSKLGASSHTSEGLYDPHHSRAASRMSGGHVSPEEHNRPLTYGRSGDKLPSGVDAQRACEQHPKQAKKAMGFKLLPTPEGSENPWRCRVTGEKHEPGLAVQRTSKPGKIRLKFGLGHCPHRSPEGHHHSFRYTQAGDKEQPGFTHKAFHPYQSTRKGMGSGCPISSKENHPVKIKENWKPVVLGCCWPESSILTPSRPE